MSKKVGGGRRRSNLTRALDSHIRNIHESFQILDKPADPSLDKVDWSEVIKLGEQVSKEATIAGMLWNGESREMKELELNMETYFNILNGFILTCHGSTVGAGPTLHKSIHASAKQVVDRSLTLFREGVSMYDSSNNNSRQRLIIPQLSGAVWEACTALKKTPTSNCMAIVRAITQVAVSVKDVHREMKELKPTSDATSPSDATLDETVDSSNDVDFGDDLSTEEMFVAQLITNVAFNSLDAFKETIRFLSTLRKSSTIELDSEDFIEQLERLLSRFEEIGSHVSELGACVYPPQEFDEMKAIAEKIKHEVGEIRQEVEGFECSKEKLFMAFQVLVASLGRLESGLAGDLASEMDRLALQN